MTDLPNMTPLQRLKQDKEAFGRIDKDAGVTGYVVSIIRQAEQAAAAKAVAREREACAKVADARQREVHKLGLSAGAADAFSKDASLIAAAIGARGLQGLRPKQRKERP